MVIVTKILAGRGGYYPNKLSYYGYFTPSGHDRYISIDANYPSVQNLIDIV